MAWSCFLNPTLTCLQKPRPPLLPPIDSSIITIAFYGQFAFYNLLFTSQLRLAFKPLLKQVYLDILLPTLTDTPTQHACTPFFPLLTPQACRPPCVTWCATPVAGTQTSIHTDAHRAPLPREIVRNGIKCENKTDSGDQTRWYLWLGKRIG